LEVIATVGKRQVFDIPAPKIFVTEHQVGSITCCGVRQSGSFLAQVAAPVQYGVRMLSLSAMLNVDFKLPFAKISQLMEDLYDCPISESTLVQCNELLYANMEEVENTIKEEILVAEVAHFDETRMQVAGKLHWFHTACTTLFCYLFVHTHRGKQALTSLQSLLPNFKQWAVHDCWSSYFAFENCQHALCNAAQA
jgi:transposase